METVAKKTILLVEDDVILAMSEKIVLEKYGYTVVTAATGEKAVEIAENAPKVDLILMDIDLGTGIDGTQAAEQILTEQDIPVVFLSSHTEPEIVEKTEKITSYGYVVKNSSSTVLDASIKMAFKLFDARIKRKLEQQALQESEQRLARAEKVAKIGNWKIILKTGKIVGSEGACAIYGVQKDQMVLKEIQQMVLPGYREQGDRSLANLIDKGKPYDLEAKICRASDGKVVDIRSIAEYDKENNIVFGVVQDISEKKLVENVLRKKNEDYETLNDQLLISIRELKTATEKLQQSEDQSASGRKGIL